MAYFSREVEKYVSFENILIMRNENFQLHLFSNFCSKHRLWVNVRTASLRRVFTIYVLEQNKKKCVPVKARSDGLTVSA